MKLYRSNRFPTRWLAFSPETGWVVFPAEDNGWERRQAAPLGLFPRQEVDRAHQSPIANP